MNRSANNGNRFESECRQWSKKREEKHKILSDVDVSACKFHSDLCIHIPNCIFAHMDQRKNKQFFRITKIYFLLEIATEQRENYCPQSFDVYIQKGIHAIHERRRQIHFSFGAMHTDTQICNVGKFQANIFSSESVFCQRWSLRTKAIGSHIFLFFCSRASRMTCTETEHPEKCK